MIENIKVSKLVRAGYEFVVPIILMLATRAFADMRHSDWVRVCRTSADVALLAKRNQESGISKRQTLRQLAGIVNANSSDLSSADRSEVQHILYLAVSVAYSDDTEDLSPDEAAGQVYSACIAARN